MHKLISYAQNFEDVMLWRALGDVQGGSYIDIGAQSPNIDSVSKLFHQHGWSGIHIDPVVAYAAELRRERPGDIVIQAAVASRAGAIVFFEVTDSGLSTAQKDVAGRHRESGFDVAEMLVPAITLDDVFEQVGGQPVHWMKVDVEGAEADVLAGWVNSSVRPWVIVVEATEPSTREPSHGGWEPALLSKGYRFAYFDGLNRFYVSVHRSGLSASFLSGPNIFDGFMLSPESSSPFSAEFRARISTLEAAQQAGAAEVERLTKELRIKEGDFLGEHARMATLLREAELGHADALATVQERANTEVARLLKDLQSKEREYLQEHIRMASLLREAEQRRADELGAMQAAMQSARAKHEDERGRVQSTMQAVLHHASNRHGEERAEWQRNADWLRGELDKRHASYKAKVESERRWKALAEQRRYELNRVYSSTSWRVTQPLRGLKLGVRRIVRGPVKAVRSVLHTVRRFGARLLAGAMRRIVAPPALRASAQSVLARFPSLRDRMRGFAVRAGVISGTGRQEHDRAQAVSLPLPRLSRQGQAVLQRMRTAANGGDA